MNTTTMRLFLRQLRFFILAWVLRREIIYVPQTLHDKIAVGSHTLCQIFATDWGGTVDGILAVDFKNRSETIHFYRVIQSIVHNSYQKQTMATRVTLVRKVVVVHWQADPINPPPVEVGRRRSVVTYRVPELWPYWETNAQGRVQYVHTPIIRLGVTLKNAPPGKLSVFAQWGNHVCRKTVDTRYQATLAAIECITQIINESELIGNYWKIQLVQSGQYIPSWMFRDLVDSLKALGSNTDRRNALAQLWEGEWRYNPKIGPHGSFSNGHIHVPNFGENEPADVWELFYQLNG